MPKPAMCGFFYAIRQLFFLYFRYPIMRKMRFLFLLLLVAMPGIAQQQFSVYFSSNKFDLSSIERDRLDNWIKDNLDSKIVAINGFTDEDGTTGYNDTLSRRRVDHIFALVSPRVKTREDFKTRSFGEQHAQTGNKSQNRRVTIHYLLPVDIPRENEILGIKPEVAETRIVRTYPTKIRVPNPDGSKTEYTLDTAFMRKLDQAKKGDKLEIRDLNFRVNTFAIIPESRARLYELLIVLQQNPNLKIDIQGHLCCMPTDRLNLSTQRAKAIYNFLVYNEIDKLRLSFQGFGSSKPLYEIPEKTEEERAANRRVEIFIVDNE
jgi:outer membrane protein OmpA-like peptidoglycan-associated protein